MGPTIGDDAGFGNACSGLGHPSIKDQLDLFGPADIQIFPNHILEEDPSADGAI